MSEIIENPTIPVKRGRGRPKGSKTKVSKAVLPVNVAIKTSPNPIITTFKDAAAEVTKDKEDAAKLKLEKLTALLRATGAKYDTFDEKEYQNRIERMNLTDLQNECMRVGLKPNVTIETKNISIDTLMTLFFDNKRSYIPDESGINRTVLSDDKRAKLLELMKSGR